MIKLHDLVKDIGCLGKQLLRFEGKYGILSREFYQAFTNGELSEFDADDEYRMEFIEWAALCKTQRKLVKKYRQLSIRQPAAGRIRQKLAVA
ncbi:MAG: hypothetical protein ACE5GO_03005 [Anaerolineales bacterium]